MILSQTRFVYTEIIPKSRPDVPVDTYHGLFSECTEGSIRASQASPNRMPDISVTAFRRVRCYKVIWISVMLVLDFQMQNAEKLLCIRCSGADRINCFSKSNYWFHWWCFLSSDNHAIRKHIVLPHWCFVFLALTHRYVTEIEVVQSNKNVKIRQWNKLDIPSRNGLWWQHKKQPGILFNGLNILNSNIEFCFRNKRDVPGSHASVKYINWKKIISPYHVDVCIIRKFVVF